MENKVWLVNESPIMTRKRSSLDVLELWRISHMKKKNNKNPPPAKSFMSFTAQDIEEFQEIFQFFDVNGTKTMHMNDLYMALRAIGFNPNPQEVDDVITLMNVDGDKYIDFSELCLIIEFIKTCQNNGKNSWLKDSFRLLDRKRNGQVSLELLRRILEKDEQNLWITSHDLKCLENCSETVNYEKLIEEMSSSNFGPTSTSVDGTTKPEQTDFEEKLQMKTVKQPASSAETEEKIGGKNSNFSRVSLIFSKRKDKMKENHVEKVDTIEKVIAGPVLLTSAIAIMTSQPNQAGWIGRFSSSRKRFQSRGHDNKRQTSTTSTEHAKGKLAGRTSTR